MEFFFIKNKKENNKKGDKPRKPSLELKNYDGK